jgi:hypothetical protein
MRITNLLRRGGDMTARCCDNELEHCHGTLVLHADGTAECEHGAVCEADEAQHELWVSCGELRCSCAGDDAPLDGWLLAA